MGVPTVSVLFCLAALFCCLNCFNIDTKYAVLKESITPGGYFGYSVAQHLIEENTSPTFDTSYVRLLVGAPHAYSEDVILNEFNQTGALFSCPLDLKNPNSVDDCSELPYPSTQRFTNIKQMAEENKTEMWLGVNIRSSGAGQFVVACGHRYKIVQKGIPVQGEDVYIDEKGEKQVNVFGIGICYNYKADLSLEDIEEDQAKAPCAGLPLVDGDNSVAGEYGVCAAGAGLATQNPDVIYGIPSAKTFMGTVAWDHKIPFAEGSAFFAPLRPTVDAINPPSKLAAYRGYSTIIVRNLLNDLKKVAIVGAPSDEDKGAVVIFELDQTSKVLKERLKFMGDQFGSGFGLSVDVVDIRNDEHPSMVVGAPFYRSSSVSDANSRETISGAIYFYQNYNDGIRGDSSKVIITPGLCKAADTSMCVNAQFGYAVTGVGDVNGDGFHDIAVGAPFYGRGAVFLFNGRADGKLEDTPSQIIMAEDISETYTTRPISGFGISLSGGQDMDGQGYADILVGAHSSSHVVLLRSRPVINVQGAIKLNNTILSPKKDETECLSNPSSTKSCIDFTICFTASLALAGSSKSSGVRATIDYTVTGDSGYEYLGNRRVRFNVAGDASTSVYTGSTVVDVNGMEQCILMVAYITEVKDVLKAVEFEMEYTLAPPSSVQYEDIDTYPIMDVLSYSIPSAKIDFKRECLTPNCLTDLAVVAMFTDVKNVIPVEETEQTGNNEFVFDSNRVDKLNLTVTLTVEESKDRAYETFVYVNLEPELRYTGVSTSLDPSASCSDGNKEFTLIVCSFGSILQGETRNVTLTLSFDELGPSFTTINVTTNTTSEDNHAANDFASLKVKVNIVTDLELLGSATRGDSVEYGDGDVKGVSAIETDADIGDYVQHTYTIINSGEYGSVSKVSLIVQWPYEIAASGEYLLYMTMTPRIVGVAAGKGQCRTDTKYINSQGYEVIEEDDLAVVPLRRRRQVDSEAAGVAPTGEVSSSNIVNLNCFEKTANCFNITCEFFDLVPKETIKVRFNSRLWNSSLAQEYSEGVDLVRIASTGSLFIDPAAKVSQTNTNNDFTNVYTEAKPNFVNITQPIKIWIIIVAAVAGILLLILIIIVCWKCGFFKRNRPTTYGVKVEKQRGEYEQVSQRDQDALT